MHTTPLLIDVRSGDLETYVGSLAKTGRKNYRYVVKHNADLVYARTSFDKALISRFMQLWEQQDIEGTRRVWGFGLGFLELLEQRGQLKCFSATMADDPRQVLALQFIEQHGDYVFCHPPMYDKDVHSNRYIAKFMWFGLIGYALKDPTISWLDLGGGNHGTWKDLLYDRKRHEGYKWLYVPERVKDAPEDATPFRVRTSLFPYGLGLIADGRTEGRLKRYLYGRCVSIIWLNRKRRIRKLVYALSRRLSFGSSVA